MSFPVARPRLSVEEYLRFEEQSLLRHEYVAGELFAMSGSTLRHNIITLNIAARLRTLFADGACGVFVNDVKVRAADDVFYYPDVVVQCAPTVDDDTMIREPCLVVEVASPSTSRVDRGEKLLAYRSMPSVQLYIVVQQRRRSVDIHARHDGTGGWTHLTIVGEGSIALPFANGTLTMGEIFQGVSLPAVGEPEPFEYSEEAFEEEQDGW